MGPFTPAAGALVVAFWFGMRGGTDVPNPTFSGATFSEQTMLVNATSINWDPCITVASAVVDGSEITVGATTTSGAHRHGIAVVEITGHDGTGQVGTATYTAPVGDLSMTLGGAVAAGSIVLAGFVLRNWVGTATTVGVAGTELHRKPSANGTEVDEIYTLLQAVTGMSGTTAVLWPGVDGNNSHSQQGAAAYAIEIKGLS